MATRTVRATLKIGDVLVDPTSAVLSNEAGTAGIIRNDTGAVVVADGVAMTKESIGTYTYTFTEPSEGLSYTAYVEFVANGNTYRVEKLLAATSASSDLYGVTFTSLRVMMADFAGLGRNTEGTGTKWTAETEYRLADSINSGYHQVLYPPILPGENVAHRWSFLQPSRTFDTEADTYAYDMPDEFGSIVGDLFYDADEGGSCVIKQVSPGCIDRKRSQCSVQGKPVYFALRPKSVDQASPQETELLLYPTPDDAYGLIYCYNAKVTPLSVDFPHPLGGQTIADVLIQSCRDMVSRDFRDDPGGREHDLFLQRLQASVETDRRNSPQFLGYNTDKVGRSSVTRRGRDFRCSLKHNLGGG